MKRSLRPRLPSLLVPAWAALFVLPACGQDPVAFEFDESAPIECATDGELLLPPSNALYHGVYPGGRTGEEDDIVPADVSEYETAVERRVAWVYFSHNWYRDRSFPLQTAGWIRDAGAVPFIRLMLRSRPEQGVREPLFTLESIIAGDFDDDLAAWGRDVAAFGTPVIVEWGTEANGEWFPWNGAWNGGPTGPELFRGAYRHIARTVCAEGPRNLTWVFHVNDQDIPNTAWNRLEHYYPGDDVVDWVGVSVYGALTPSDGAWRSFAADMDQVLPRIISTAPGKPVFVLEFGMTMGNPLGDASTWADEALTALRNGRWPSVRGFSWWNERWQNDSNPANDTNMRVQDVPGASEVFRRQLHDPLIVDRPLLAVRPGR